MIACNKNDESTNAGPSLETPEAIVMTPGEATPNGTIYSITIIEPAGATRWEKRQWGFPFQGMMVDKGFLFVGGAAPDYSIGKYAVYDLKTGAEIWSRQKQGESYAQSVVRNDTLFCCESVQLSATVNVGYIAAYNAKTGTLYWKQRVGDYLYPYNLILKDSSMYFITTTLPVGSGGKLTSLNIRTRNVNWSRNLNPLDLYAQTPMYLLGDRLILSTIIPQPGWAGVNRFTGAFNLSVTSRKLESPFMYNGSMFGVSEGNPIDADDGVYVYDVLTGTQKWKASIPDINLSSSVTLSDAAGLFISSSDNNGYYLKGYNVSAGLPKWTIRLPANELLFHPVTVGNRIYTHNVTFNPATGQFTKSRMFLYDVATGQAKDSFDIPAYRNSAFGVIGSSGNIYSTIEN
jgi:hypothetical protein